MPLEKKIFAILLILLVAGGSYYAYRLFLHQDEELLQATAPSRPPRLMSMPKQPAPTKPCSFVRGIPS
jgi:uncharacterized membrane protein YdjX (TVP38/TMEM64 family)